MYIVRLRVYIYLEAISALTAVYEDLA